MFFLYCIFLSISFMSNFLPVWLCQLHCLLALESFFLLLRFEFHRIYLSSAVLTLWQWKTCKLNRKPADAGSCDWCWHAAHFACAPWTDDNVGLNSFQIGADVTDRCSLYAIWTTLFLYICFVRLQSAYEKVGQTPDIVQKVSCCSCWLQPTLLPSSSHFLGCSILLQH